MLIVPLKVVLGGGNLPNKIELSHIMPLGFWLSWITTPTDISGILVFQQLLIAQCFKSETRVLFDKDTMTMQILFNR